MGRAFSTDRRTNSESLAVDRRSIEKNHIARNARGNSLLSRGCQPLQTRDSFRGLFGFSLFYQPLYSRRPRFLVPKRFVVVYQIEHFFLCLLVRLDVRLPQFELFLVHLDVGTDVFIFAQFAGWPCSVHEFDENICHGKRLAG